MATPLPSYIYYLFNHNCLEWTENLCTYPLNIRKLLSKIPEKKDQYLVYHPFASRTAATLLGIDSHRFSKNSPSISWVQTTLRASARYLLIASAPPLSLVNVGKVLVQLFLQLLPTVLNRIEVWGIGWPFHSLYIVFCKPSYSISCSMYLCTILLKDRISNCILHLLPDIN